MHKEVEVKFDEDAYKEYEELQELVAKGKSPYISKGVFERYGTDKIFRVKLVGYWRLLYTLIGEDVKIIAFILEFMDHDRYDKIFGYRGK